MLRINTLSHQKAWRSYLEFKEAYLEYIDAMAGTTGRASIKPTTYYDLADALMEESSGISGFLPKEQIERL